MARRELLTEEERASLFGVPTARAALARHYTLGPDDLDFLAGRRGDANRLGAATWMALLRHPGFGLRHDEVAPRELIAYLTDQLGLPEALFGAYGSRAKTRLEHAWDVAAHLGVRGFEAGDITFALDRAAQAAWASNQGLPIVQAVVEGLRERGVILPAAAASSGSAWPGVRVLASARWTLWRAPSRPNRPRLSTPCWFPIPRPG